MVPPRPASVVSGGNGSIRNTLTQTDGVSPVFQPKAQFRAGSDIIFLSLGLEVIIAALEVEFHMSQKLVFLNHRYTCSIRM